MNRAFLIMEYYKNLSLENIVYKNDEGIECVEQWKDVVGYENAYKVSDLGRLKSLDFNHTKTEGVLKQTPNKKGYIRPTLKTKSIQKRFNLHRLVAIAFIESRQNKLEVNHINGIKTNNRIENLEWCTRSENQKHAYKIGLIISNKGECSRFSKLSNKEVLEIRIIGKSDLIKNTALKYNVSVKTIYRIINNINWKHI